MQRQSPTTTPIPAQPRSIGVNSYCDFHMGDWKAALRFYLALPPNEPPPDADETWQLRKDKISFGDVTIHINDGYAHRNEEESTMDATPTDIEDGQILYLSTDPAMIKNGLQRFVQGNDLRMLVIEYGDGSSARVWKTDDGLAANGTGLKSLRDLALESDPELAAIIASQAR